MSMPLEGEALGVELVALWHAGRIGLPRIAEAYVEANRTLAGTASGDGAFSRGYGGEYYTGGASSGQVYGPWTQLRNTIQTILGNTANNVEQAGVVLVQIADAYAQTDAAAADRLRREWDNRAVDPTDPRDKPLETGLPDPVFP
jgi:hypothetical protein